MKNIRLIIYDLDGTLIDSADIVTLLINDLRKDLDKKPLVKKDLIPWISLGGEDLMQKALEVNTNESKSFLKIFRERYHDMPTPQSSIFDGVKECLNSLSQLNYFLAISTNKPRSLAEKVLNETNLAKYFECLNAGGDLPNKKPHVSNLSFCQDYFGLTANEVLLIGDSKVDQQLAHDGKVRFVFYEKGYDDGVDKNKIFAALKQHQDLLQIVN
jgi:phosphoglycolate phosphatase